MIAIFGKTAVPSESAARAAQEAVPYPVPDMTFRRVGGVLIGIATRPDFVIESISVEGPSVAAITGRIDNAAELYAEFAAAGTRPATPNDADVVVTAFCLLGTQAVNRFRGAFSGFVSDGTLLHCFRDHMGFRGLFFRDTAESFVASGEARPVAVASGLPLEPDMMVLEHMVFYGMPSYMPAALKGVNRQPQSSVISIGAAMPLRTDRYWRPWELLETLDISVEDAKEEFLRLLRQAVARSMVGRTTVFLSGGLDSPAIAAVAAPEHARRLGTPIGAISASFPHLPDVDESELVRLVAARFGMELHTFQPTARTLDDAEAWAERFSSPLTVLSIPEVWDSYTMAHRLGYRTILTGEFAEVSYGKFPHMLAHLVWRGRFAALYRVMRAEHARGAGRRDLIADALTAFVPGSIANWYLKRREPPRHQVMPDWMEIEPDYFVGPRPDMVAPPWARWRALQLAGTSGSTVTMEADAVCATMAGVEVRRPFADIDLWEFFLRLPAEVKFPVLQWKALARSALRGVIPDEILDRLKKVVFDSHVQTQIDYPVLRRLLIEPRVRIPRIDYDRLRAHLEAEDLTFFDWIRVRELARVHAFLSGFSS